MIFIEKAKIKDLNDIVNLSCKSALFHESMISYRETDKKLKNILKKYLAKDIYSKNSLVLVAKDNQKIIGYLLSLINKRPDLFKIKQTGYIDDIFIEDNYRNKGIGKKLVAEAFTWLKKRKIKTVEINIATKNIPALKFWDKLYFEDVSIEKYKKI